jgi:hypothetical protein
LLLTALLNVRVGRIVTSPPMIDESVSAEHVAYVRARGMSVVLGAALALLMAFFIPGLSQATLISIPLWRFLLTRRISKGAMTGARTEGSAA